MNSDHEPKGVIHFRARRLVAKWADKLSHEWVVRRKDLSKVPDRQLKAIDGICLALRRAFEADDTYKRDWFLTWARCLNAQAVVAADPLMKGILDAGGIPMAKESSMEQAIYHVQRYCQHKMAICKRRGRGCTNPYYFRRRRNQTLCGKKCRLANIRESKDTYETNKRKDNRALGGVSNRRK